VPPGFRPEHFSKAWHGQSMEPRRPT